MSEAILVWALWVSGGGRVNSGYLVQPSVAAYFQEQAECERVQKIVADSGKTIWSQCIQASYLIK